MCVGFSLSGVGALASSAGWARHCASALARLTGPSEHTAGTGGGRGLVPAAAAAATAPAQLTPSGGGAGGREDNPILAKC